MTRRYFLFSFERYEQTGGIADYKCSVGGSLDDAIECQIADFIDQMKAAKEAGTLTAHAVKLTSGKGWIRLDLVPAEEAP